MPQMIGQPGAGEPGPIDDGGQADDVAAGEAEAVVEIHGHGPAEVPAERARHTQDVLLIRQFLASTLKRFEYISLPIVGEGGAIVDQPYQLLDLERKNIVVRP